MKFCILWRSERYKSSSLCRLNPLNLRKFLGPLKCFSIQDISCHMLCNIRPTIIPILRRILIIWVFLSPTLFTIFIVVCTCLSQLYLHNHFILNIKTLIVIKEPKKNTKYFRLFLVSQSFFFFSCYMIFLSPLNCLACLKFTKIHLDPQYWLHIFFFHFVVSFKLCIVFKKTQISILMNKPIYKIQIILFILFLNIFYLLFIFIWEF